MYYRVAIQTNSFPVWKWKSTVLRSLDALFRFLKLHHTIPAHRLRIFTSSCREDLNEMLLCENSGFDNGSVTAEQFLRERHLHVWETAVSEHLKQEAQPASDAGADVSLQQALPASSTITDYVFAYALNPLDRSRQEIEFGAGGDHDCPYIFTLPQYVPELLAWMKLLEKVQSRDAGAINRTPTRPLAL